MTGDNDLTREQAFIMAVYESQKRKRVPKRLQLIKRMPDFMIERLKRMREQSRIEAQEAIAKLSPRDKEKLDKICSPSTDFETILERGKGLGGERIFREGRICFLAAYAQAMRVPRKVLVLALKRAPGECPRWFRESMTNRELKDIGRAEDC